MVKRTTDWTPAMEQRAALEGRQIKCLIASEGHLWMRGYFDRFPSAVRRRLAESAFNICPACMDEEAHTAARQRKETKPSVGTYLLVIKTIEQKLMPPPSELDEETRHSGREPSVAGRVEKTGSGRAGEIANFAGGHHHGKKDQNR